MAKSIRIVMERTSLAHTANQAAQERRGHAPDQCCNRNAAQANAARAPAAENYRLPGLGNGIGESRLSRYFLADATCLLRYTRNKLASLELPKFKAAINAAKDTSESPGSQGLGAARSNEISSPASSAHIANFATCWWPL